MGTGPNGTVVAMGIGEAADQTGVSVSALRYYDQEGLLPQVERDGAGRRRFTEDNVRWIRFLDGGFEPYPNLARFMERMGEDEGVQRALAREKGRA